MTYTIIVDAREVAEAGANTKEPFAGLFITRLPSEMEEVGYEIIGNTMIVKYEGNEDGRISVTSKMPYAIHGNIPRIFGIAAKVHNNITQIKLGKDTHRIDVLVNSPVGVYFNEGKIGGKIIRHETEGLVFTRNENTYCAVTKTTINSIYERFIKRGSGVCIPAEYLVRFVVSGKYVYQSMSLLFNDGGVAASFNNSISENDWQEKSQEVINSIEVDKE